MARIFIFLGVLICAASAKAEDAKQLECLAKVVFHEARGEPREGQLAVAHVVLNRVSSPLFPNTICKVVHQKKQFSGFSKRRNYDNYKSKLWDNSLTSAALVFLGKREDNTEGALFYLNPKKVKKYILTSWTKKYKVHKDIHNHRFFGVKEA